MAGFEEPNLAGAPGELHAPRVEFERRILRPEEVPTGVVHLPDKWNGFVQSVEVTDEALVLRSIETNMGWDRNLVGYYPPDQDEDGRPDYRALKDITLDGFEGIRMGVRYIEDKIGHFALLSVFFNGKHNGVVNNLALGVYRGFCESVDPYRIDSVELLIGTGKSVRDYRQYKLQRSPPSR